MSNSNDEEVVLSLRNFGVSFGDRVVLSDVNLDIPDRGVTVLVGPSGSGKSTLLRTVCGLNDAQPSLETWGQARYGGDELGSGDRPGLVSKTSRRSPRPSMKALSP